MSYARTGNVGDTILSVAQATGNILSDPYLPTVAGYVIQLHNMEQPSKPSATGSKPSTPGIGLVHVVKPLRIYVWARKNPWVVPVGIIAAIALPMLIGYRIGRSRR